jgi:hypothetical protein
VKAPAHKLGIGQNTLDRGKLGMFFDQIGRHPPVLAAAIGEDIGGFRHLAFLFQPEIGLGRVHPKLWDDVRFVVFGQRGDRRRGGRLHDFHVTAIALLHEECGDAGDDLARGPVHLGDRNLAAIGMGDGGRGQRAEGQCKCQFFQGLSPGWFSVFWSYRVVL